MISTLVASLLLGQSVDLKFPEKVTGRPGQFVVVKPTSTSGKIVKYFVVTPGLEMVPAGLLKDDTATLVQAQYAGVYVVYAYTAKGDEPSDPVEIKVTIGQLPNPVPIPPNPNPAPTPDNPDPLLEILGPIWGALNEPDKIKNAKTLSQYYRRVSEIYKDTSIITTGQAFKQIVPIRSSMLPDSALVLFRNTVGEQINQIMPKDPTTVLNQDLRNKASGMYERMAKIVDKLVSESVQ